MYYSSMSEALALNNHSKSLLRFVEEYVLLCPYRFFRPAEDGSIYSFCAVENIRIQQQHGKVHVIVECRVTSQFTNGYSATLTSWFDNRGGHSTNEAVNDAVWRYVWKRFREEGML